MADDGLGMSDAPASAGTGIGLTNVQARLERLYGEAHRLTLRPAQPTGLIVDVTLPLRRVEEEAGEPVLTTV